MESREPEFKLTIHVTFMYDNDTITFEECDVAFSDTELIILVNDPKSIHNTIIPRQAIKYYSIIEPKKGTKLEVL